MKFCMEVNCDGCGRCCVSPFNEILVSRVKHSKTRHLLTSLIRLLIEDGILMQRKVVRTGWTVARDEIEKMINEGLIEGVAPGALLFIKKYNVKAVALRLRHIMMPFKRNESMVPVFGCIFFNNETGKCEVFTREFRPRLCRVFPFDVAYKIGKLKQHGKIRKYAAIPPVCGFERVKGTLTAKQIKQVEQWLDLLKPPTEGASVDSPSSLRKLISKLQFPAAVPVSNRDLQVLGVPMNFKGQLTLDWRRDLAAKMTEILSGVYGKDKLNPKTTGEQKQFSEYITNKLAKSYEWWENIRLGKENVEEIYEAMAEVFHGRYLRRMRKLSRYAATYPTYGRRSY